MFYNLLVIDKKLGSDFIKTYGTNELILDLYQFIFVVTILYYVLPVCTGRNHEIPGSNLGRCKC
jgi:hypothetical protein